jgi:hypothetical protein
MGEKIVQMYIYNVDPLRETVQINVTMGIVLDAFIRIYMALRYSLVLIVVFCYCHNSRV